MPRISYPPLKTGKKKKKTSKEMKKVLETVDDFIAAGLEFEESGDRWLSEDRPKAGRFYTKAIQAYTSALGKKPNSVDAAYNRARLQLTLATDGSLLQGVTGLNITLLEVALKSHKECLLLDSENADILFNTGQTFTSLADAYANDAKTEGEPAYSRKAVYLLLEAISVFDKASWVQETEVRIMEIEAVDIDMGNDGVPLPTSEIGNIRMELDVQIHDQVEAEWALVRNPVTQEDILDTALAKLEALTSLWSLWNHIEGLADPIAYVKAAGSEVLKKLSDLGPRFPERQSEIFLTKADYLVAAADACFKAQKLSFEQFDVQVRESFDNRGGVDMSSNPKLLGRKAEAHIQFCLTVSETANSDRSQIATLLWKNYSFAAKDLTTAATLDKNNPSLHCLRGDVEMWRSRLSTPVAKDSRTLLLKNAGVYYRGAVKVALANNKRNEEIIAEASVKEKLLAIETGVRGATIENIVNEIKRMKGWKEIVLEAIRIGIFDSRILTAFI